MRRTFQQFEDPLASESFPKKLRGHVVSPGPEPRIHGYDVQGDLAQYYGWSDVVLMTLTAEEPTESQSQAFQLALTFLSPRSILEAPVHAACVAQRCGAPQSAVLGAGAIALAEQGRDRVSRCHELVAWLNQPSGRYPDGFLPSDDDERASVQRFKKAVLRTGLEIPAFSQELSLEAALFATLAACGVRQTWQLETVLLMTGLASMAAEAAAVSPGDLKSYPINLPAFVYTTGESTGEDE